MNVQIRVAGVDITSECFVNAATFTSRTNGAPGECEIRVRAYDVRSFTVGSRIECFVEGTRIWDGYLMSVGYAYPFEAMKVEANSPRIYILRGVDLNILFRKRIVYNKTNPKSMDGPLFPAHTSDVTAISELVTNWLDLSGDNLNVTSGVTNVADVNEDQPARPFGPSQTWGDAMGQISALTGAVWYLDADRVLRYVDDEAETAPFGLSDAPTAEFVGMRDVQYILGNEPLTNDYFAWGMGYGSDQPVVSEAKDTSSIATHGLWQDSRVLTAVYKQATIDRIVSSYVYGSPSNRRGRNEPQPILRCKIVEPGLRAGMGVHVVLDAWSIDIVLPIRQLTFQYIAPGFGAYDLVLSRLVDTPWTSIDPYRVALPSVKPPKRPTVPKVSLPSVQASGGCDCGITDTFSRTANLGWGISDAGFPWLTDPPWAFEGSNPIYVDGSVGIFVATNYLNGSRDSPYSTMVPLDLYPGSRDIRFAFNAPSGIHPDQSITVFFGETIDPAVSIPYLKIKPSEYRWKLQMVGNGPWLVDQSYSLSIAPDTWYEVHISVENPADQNQPGIVRTNIWPATTSEPAGWQMEWSAYNINTGAPVRFEYDTFEIDFWFDFEATPPAPFQNSLLVDNVSLSDVTKCSLYMLDGFRRPDWISGGWGVSDTGYQWLATSGADQLQVQSDNYRSLGRIKPGTGYIDVALSGFVVSPPYTFRAAVAAPLTSSSNESLALYFGPSLQFYPAEGRIQLSYLGHTPPGSSTTWNVADTFFILVAAEVTSTEVRAKAWPAWSPEPSTWSMSITYASVGESAPQNATVQVILTPNSSGSHAKWDIDYIDVKTPNDPCFEAPSSYIIDDWSRAYG